MGIVDIEKGDFMKKNINGCELHYEIMGKGIPTICLHGSFVDKNLMKGCLETSFEGTPNFERIYVDLVGMDESPSNTKVKGSDELLQLLVEFIKEIVRESPFILIGESFGGYLSLALIKYFKTQILGMFLICPCVIGNKEKRVLPEKINLPAHPIDISASEKEAYDAFINMAVVINENTWKRYYEEVWTGIKKADGNFLSTFEENYVLTEEDEFTKIHFQNPAVFLMGRQDHMVGFEDTLSLRKNFSQGTFAILNGVGHNLQIEQPELFDCFLTNFLECFNED